MSCVQRGAAGRGAWGERESREGDRQREGEENLILTVFWRLGVTSLPSTSNLLRLDSFATVFFCFHQICSSSSSSSSSSRAAG